MLAKVLTCAVVGLNGQQVEVEVQIASYGMANFLIVGLPDATVQEARERVRTAIKNSGLVFPMRRVTVNLAPADPKKRGACLRPISGNTRAHPSRPPARTATAMGAS